MKYVAKVVFCLLLGLLALAPSNTFAQRITFAGGCGFWGGDTILDTILVGTPVTLFLRYDNPTANKFNISNGFEIYSPDGATWSTPVADTLNGEIPRSNWDLNFAMNVFHGTSRDTVGIIGAKISAPGLPPGFDGVPYGIKLEPFSAALFGLHVCLDSAWFRPGGTWKWTASGGINSLPTWGGPYCFTLYDLPCKRVAGAASPGCGGCCIGTTGNVDGDSGDRVDISDVTALVGFLFESQPISECPSENNVDADTDGLIDIADLVRLTDYLFLAMSLPNCTSNCRRYTYP